MNLIVAILKLLEEFGLLDPTNEARIREQARAWYADLGNENDPEWKKKAKEWGELWWVQVVIAVVFIWARRELMYFMNPNLRPQEEDDYDEDDYPQPMYPQPHYMPPGYGQRAA